VQFLIQVPQQQGLIQLAMVAVVEITLTQQAIKLLLLAVLAFLVVAAVVL
jgi:hypothetical protein